MAVLRGPIEKFFNSPIPQEVWYYTTLAGLEGILTSGEVWATEVHFTTDASEFVHAREIVVSFLEAITPTDDDAARAKAAGLDMISFAFDKGLLSPDKTEVYVASFSAIADLKSQWIHYADRGRGVSLAFNLKEVRPPQNLSLGITVAPCVYLKEEKEVLLEAGLNHFINAVTKLHRETEDPKWRQDQLRDWFRVSTIYGLEFDRPAYLAEMEDRFRTNFREAILRSSFDLLRLASHCKSSFFQEEREWRIALPRLKSKPFAHNKVQFRGTRQQIPYISSNLFQDQKRLPITQVMLGPLCKQHEEVRKVLANCGYEVPLSESAIPMRDPESIE